MARLVGLLVGIDAYADDVGPLRGCVRDVGAVEELLRQRGADAFDDIAITTLTDDRATRAAVIDGFRSTFAGTGPDDVAVFFYAGHGAQEPAPPQHEIDEPDGLDETLVLVDSRSPGGYDLADKELAVLVGEVSARGTHVLVVLDCCHSGSGVRDLGDGTAIRRTHPRFVPRPASAYLDGVLDPSGPYRAARYVLLGACRSDELAKEVRAPGGRRGAFTVALETALHTSPGPLSYALLHRAVLTAVRGTVPEQTPVLEHPAPDDGNRLFLGGGSVRAVPLITAGHDRRGWTLHAGVLHGLPDVAVEGARTWVTLHPLADTELTEATAVARATVGAVRSTDADLAVDPGGAAVDRERTYRAVIRAMPTAAVRILVDDDVPRWDEVVAVLGAAPGCSVATTADDVVDLRLAVDAGRLRLVRPGARRPLVAVRPAPAPGRSWDPGVLRAVSAEAVHVGRWLGLWRRHNPTTRLGPEDVLLDLLETDGSPAPLVDGAVRVQHGPQAGASHLLRIRVRNGSGRRLHVAVLALSEHYGVQSLLTGGGEWLDDGQERYVPAEGGGYDVHFSVEPGGRSTTDLIKVIASTEAFDASAVQQDDLAPPTERDRLRGSDGRAVHLGPPRVLPDSADDWTTRDVLVHTVRDREEDDDRAWRLAEEFDTAAREPGRGPTPALTDPLAAALSDGGPTDDILAALTDALGGLCHGDDLDQAERYAAHATALARQLGADHERALLAAVDVHTAQICSSRGDGARAAELLARCEPDLAELVPALLADREWVLGGLAEADGRTDDAHAHAVAARTRFLEHERWGQAAAAAEAAASLHPALTAEAWEDWRTAAELGTRAGFPEEAKRCVEHACLLLFGRLEQARPETSAELEPLCTTARALAAQYGLDEITARLGLPAATLAAESDVLWPEIVRRHEAAAAELVALTSTPVQADVERARVDASLGRAALAHHRVTDARRLLGGAATALREAGSAAEADALGPLLALLDAATGAPVAAARGRDGTVGDPAMRAAVLMTEAMELMSRGETFRALERVDEVIALGPPPTPTHGLVLEGLRAAARPQDPARAAVLARIEDELATPGPRPRSATTALTQVARLLRTGRPATPTAAVEDVPAALAELDTMAPTDPGRAGLTVAVIRALVAGGPLGPPSDLRPLDRLLDITDSTPPADPDWSRLRATARALALQRAMAEDELTDLHAARARLAEVEDEAGNHPELAPLLGATRSIVEMLAVRQRGTGSGLGDMVSVMRGVLGSLPGDVPIAPAMSALTDVLDDLGAAFDRGADLAPHLTRLTATAAQLPEGHLRTAFEEAIGQVSLVAGMRGPQPAQRLDDDELAALAARAESGELLDPDVNLHRLTTVFAALQGGDETDPGRVDTAVDLARHARRAAPLDHPQRVFVLATLALALNRRFELTTRTADLQEALTVLEEARRLAGGPSHRLWPMVNEMLGEVGRRLDSRSGRHLDALEGLRGHVWQVLAAPGHAAATRAARDAGSAAVGVARLCIQHDDPASALKALDAGRGLALFASVGERSITDWLTGLGEHELAERWRTAVTAGAAQLPGQLRADVLDLLHERNAGADLLDPPAPDEIGRALTRLDADALVYLVPGDGPMPGLAVIASATGRVSFLALPDLLPDQHPDVEAYLTALHRRSTRAVGNRPYLVAAEDQPGTELRASLDALCSWAWHAAMGPVIEGYLQRLPAPAARPHRVVLVPMGDLARVPWQAARRPDGVRAVELVGVSLAASARMLLRSAALPPLTPPVSGLFVADPATRAGTPDLPVAELRSARWEAMAIREAHYLGARYLGRRIDDSTSPSGSGTAAEVERWLTDLDPAAGSLLHLACHAVVDSGTGRGPTTAPSAFLMLAERSRLTAEELVGLLGGRPERAVALVVLAACHTGTSLSGYDEAYSLGTAFLAGGARTVVSTQWAVDDLPSAALMFMFHHHLRTDDVPAWEALRRAQLWMLDRHRTMPAEMPAPLRRQLDRAKLDALTAWAGFVHWGH